ncbi:hypothetical protein IE81DRAFT_329781 [Ceraceosorus guamensis]|uniref:Uncharacterized protein n=1 Tax=Ceraceosorus guamensis TaxID=1522189 RepID=A0A316W3E2_9BASI|nr:hypothetical protein IE81DRAFT_329781 [Ceraceosorus guamensis]PWN43121.1 hypothetical protein IE81DRAFT_329781 [Ceraceosorus guamensis]
MHTSSVGSSSSRPSSVASNSSGHSSQGYAQGQLAAQPSLLSPTLASALGINVAGSSKSGRPGSAGGASKSRNGVARPSLTADGWSRRPSLPNVPSMINRVSMISIASFESLPEGEPVNFAASPLSVTSASDAPHEDLSASTSTATDSPTLSQGDSWQSPTSPTDEASVGSISMNRSSSTASRPGHALQRSATDPTHSMIAFEGMMRRRHAIAMELLETERVFIASLKLVNESYYQPLMALSKGLAAPAGVTSAAPVLSRQALNEIFSNFSDILSLNSELFSRLDDRLSGRARQPPPSRPASVAGPTSPRDAAPSSAEAGSTNAGRVDPWHAETDTIGDTLVPVVPYLKMYSLYVKNFSAAMARIETERKANDAFNRFLKDTERATWGKASASGGFGFGLGFQAHLLTIVQRIPRYKMMVGDLVKYTPSNHRDYPDLLKAFGVIDQVAAYINENVRQHEMILVMLGLQRSLTGLTEPLIVPGRALLKRGTLLKACRKNIQPREFFLFTDCLVYASPVGGGLESASAAWTALARGGGLGVYGGSAQDTGPPSAPNSPRTIVDKLPLAPISADAIDTASRSRTSSADAVLANGRPLSVSLQGFQLQFRAKFPLQDCTVVGVEKATSPLHQGLRHSIEIRTPDKSFAVYAESAEAKETWLSTIRDARDDLMTARRTLQAEEDTSEVLRERRRSLYGRAGPSYCTPQQARRISAPSTGWSFTGNTSADTSGRPTSPLASSASVSADWHGAFGPKSESGNSLATLLSSGCPSSDAGITARSRTGLRVLEDYNAPVWVPDSSADKCIVCAEAFGMWRRKHHCRLCGQVVCWACSQRSFLIARYEDDGGEAEKPARACDACYDSVFPAEEEHSSPQMGTAAVVLPEPSPAAQSDTSRSTDFSTSDSATSDYPATPAERGPLNSVDSGQISHIAIHVQDENEVAAEAGNEGSKPSRSAASRQQKIWGAQGRPSTPSWSQVQKPEDAGHLTSHQDRSDEPRRATPPSRRGPALQLQRASGAGPQLFKGGLTPQVQAATSGSGTFRLVTPRLTTPEAEMLPRSRHGAQGEGDGNIRIGDGGSYFAGAVSEDHLGDMPPPIPRARKKPLSAAARLSTFYGVSPASMPSIAKKSPLESPAPP